MGVCHGVVHPATGAQPAGQAGAVPQVHQQVQRGQQVTHLAPAEKSQVRLGGTRDARLLQRFLQ
jgi:hypothetical protein